MRINDYKIIKCHQRNSSDPTRCRPSGLGGGFSCRKWPHIPRSRHHQGLPGITLLRRACIVCRWVRSYGKEI